MQYKNSNIFHSLDTPGIFFQDSLHIAVHRHTGPPSVSLSTNQINQGSPQQTKTAMLECGSLATAQYSTPSSPPH